MKQNEESLEVEQQQEEEGSDFSRSQERAKEPYVRDMFSLTVS